MIDIRRCTKEELDQINERARLWRARNTAAQDEPKPEATPTGQMNLWENEEI
jgi:hypothetical protein